MLRSVTQRRTRSIGSSLPPLPTVPLLSGTKWYSLPCHPHSVLCLAADSGAIGGVLLLTPVTPLLQLNRGAVTAQQGCCRGVVALPFLPLFPSPKPRIVPQLRRLLFARKVHTFCTSVWAQQPLSSAPPHLLERAAFNTHSTHLYRTFTAPPLPPPPPVPRASSPPSPRPARPSAPAAPRALRRHSPLGRCRRWLAPLAHPTRRCTAAR